jgi:hypothetical protein
MREGSVHCLEREWKRMEAQRPIILSAPVSLDQRESTDKADSPAHPLIRLLTAESPNGRRLRIALLTIVVVQALWTIAEVVRSAMPNQVYAKDYLAVYVLARAIAAGLDPLTPLSVLVERFVPGIPWTPFPHPTPHPPTLGLLALPLAALPYQISAAVWTAGELLCLTLTVPLLAQLGGWSLPRHRLSLVWLAVIGLWPVLVHLRYGQMGLVILLLTCLMLLALRRGQSGRAGLLFSLALCVKPVTWPLALMLLFQREWRALASAALTGASLVTATALLIGPARLMVYMRDALPMSSDLYASVPTNISLWSFGYRVFSGTVDYRVASLNLFAPPLIDAPALARPVAIGLTLAALLAVAWAARSLSARWAGGLLLGTSIVLSPIAWPHYLVLALLPVALVMGGLARAGWLTRPTTWSLVVIAMLIASPLWYALTFQIIAVPPPVNIPSASLWANLLTTMPTVAVLALCALVAWMGRQARGGGRS